MRLIFIIGLLMLSTNIFALNVDSKQETKTVTVKTKKQNKIIKKIQKIRKKNRKQGLNGLAILGIIGMILGIGIAVLGWVHVALLLKIFGVIVFILSSLIFLLGLAFGQGGISFC